MELLDRYMQAVKMFLPKSQEEDIAKELSENIQSQMADREAELGRPLDQAEQAALLKQYGHPMLLGIRYRSGAHLIGPFLLPFYWLALKTILLIVAGGHVLAAAVLVATGKPSGEVVHTLLNFFSAALPVFGWITILFAVLDRCVTKFHLVEKATANWNPSSLPPLRKPVKGKPAPL